MTKMEQCCVQKYPQQDLDPAVIYHAHVVDLLLKEEEEGAGQQRRAVVTNGHETNDRI